MKRALLPFLPALFTLSAFAQHPDRLAGSIRTLHAQGVTFPVRGLFQEVPRTTISEQRWNQACSNATLLTLDASASASLLAERPSYFALELPGDEGPLTLDLEYTEIITSDFSVVQASTGSAAVMDQAVHYRGAIRGVPGSVVAISVFPNEIMGLVSDDESDRVLGRLSDATDGAHIFYREDDLLATHQAVCGTMDTGEPYDPNALLSEGMLKTVKCVRLYWEVNYDIFQGKGSVANATNYVTGLFNQMATLYANDGIDVLLSEVFVWDVPSPYTFTDTGDQLDQFGITRTSFNGDLAHLLGYTGGGGVAWLNTLCGSTNYRMAYSNINSTFQNVPTYSWSVEVVTHETGHNLGSRHTHACAWNGNNTAIDGCGPAAGYTEGTCAQGPLPASSVGGTIMSYCHLTSSTIKFANGFGPQPMAVIVNRVNSSSCLANCATTCSAPTGLAAGSITTSSAVLTWTAASGAVTYTLQWKPASSGTWTTVNGIASTSYALGSLAAGTNYSFQVMTVCASGSSSYASPVNFTTTSPACTVPTGLMASNITSNSAMLTWGPVSGGTSYDLQWKQSTASTWTTVTGLSSASYAINGLVAGTAYSFQVRTVCGAASSAYAAAVNFTTSAAVCADNYEPNDSQATVVNANTTITALIGSTTDLDWFRFANSSTLKNIRIKLTNLPANYNLRLYNGSTLKASSSNTGTANETIIMNNASVSSNYRVRVHGASGAFSTTQCYSLSIEVGSTPFAMPEGSTEAVAGEEGAPEIILFPNPASDAVTVQLPAHSRTITIELLDALGQVVHARQQGAADSPSLVELSLAERREGLYLVRVTIDGVASTQRLLVSR